MLVARLPLEAPILSSFELDIKGTQRLTKNLDEM